MHNYLALIVVGSCCVYLRYLPDRWHPVLIARPSKIGNGNKRHRFRGMQEPPTAKPPEDVQKANGYPCGVG